MSLELIQTAEDLGREAAAKDSWMVPEPDDGKGVDRFGRDRLMREADGWAETDHFRHYWRPKLVELVPENEQDDEARTDILLEAQEAFFSAWLEAHMKKEKRT